MNHAETNRTERIADRLRGRRLLVTGTTGLLAKVFVEKLLRSAPEIGSLHLLLRGGGDGKPVEARLRKEVLASSVFGRLRAKLGADLDRLFEQKIHVVAGDLTQDRLGMSEADYASLCGKIDVVVNSAAAVTFDERLDIAVELNALGPARLAQFCRDAGDASLMQVSTCYVSGRRTGSIPESLHAAPPGAPNDIDEMVTRMRAKVADVLADSSVGGEQRRQALIEAGMSLAREWGWHDTYTMTKWIGEHQVARAASAFPVTILRPAIIEGSYDEPVPGWIDGLRMADPMIIGFGRGRLGQFTGDPKVILDVIPVDFVANAMIAALPMPTDPKRVEVYQVCSGESNPVRVGEVTASLHTAFQRWPMLDSDGNKILPTPMQLMALEEFNAIWQRKLDKARRWRDRLQQWGKMPARRRRLSSLVAQMEQLLYFAKIYSPYTHLDCCFEDRRLRALGDSLHAEDRAAFPFDVRVVDWHDYVVERHIPGLREFVLGGGKGGKRQLPRPIDRLPDAKAVREGVEKATTLFDAFEHTAKACGGKIALQICRSGRWTRFSYEEALAATGTIARRFLELGLRQGDRVTICADNSPEWGLTYLAAMRAGLTAVPLDPQMPAGEVLSCSRFAESKAIFTSKGTHGAIAQAIAGDQSAGDPSATFDMPVVCLEEPFVPAAGVSRDEAPAPVPVSSDDVASILFTSGTTVEPKAVQLTHANFLFNARALLAIHKVDARDSLVSVLPMYHAFEFTGGFVVPMITGATVTYVEQIKGPEVIAAMQASGCTLMLAVPRLLQLFHDAIRRKVREAGWMSRSAFSALESLSDLTGRRLARTLFGRVHKQFGGKLRMFVSGGSALDPELHRAFGRMGFAVCEGYGLTETSPVLTVNPPIGGKAGSVGCALPGIELDIRNVDRDSVGELWARGPSIMRGYLKNPTATAEVLRDGWLRTGDLCRKGEDGFYYIVGRVKDIIVTSAGKNVYPDEVEVAYRDVPYVGEMCVVGLPMPGGIGETVHAVVVPDFEAAPDMDRSTVERVIRDAVQEIGRALPSHQRIQTLHIWSEDLPKTSTLKAKRGIIRKRLLEVERAPAGDARRKQAQPVVASDPRAGGAVEQHVRRILSRLTGEPEASIRSDRNLHLDLGVDSLMKLEIISELEGAFGFRCPEEKAAAVARVGDLVLLVGDRQPVGGKEGRSAAVGGWRQRLHAQRSPENGRRDLAPSTDGTGGSVNGNGNGRGIWEPARRFARGGLSLFFHSYVRVQADGLEHIPKTGPFVLAANHTSHLDSGSVLSAIGGRRRVWVVGAKDYFFNTAAKRLVFGTLFDTIPFERNSEGLDGMRQCIEVLSHGDGVLFFPEGTRSTTGRIQTFRPGVAIMATEAEAPIVPVRIEHAFDLFPKGARMVRPGMVRVTFGKPIVVHAAEVPSEMEAQYRWYRDVALRVEHAVERLGADQKTSAQEVAV